jgi:hypothetical protein
MSYDYAQSSGAPGPNAPLSNGCGNAQYPNANAVGAIAAWNQAGMPLKKIHLGANPHSHWLAHELMHCAQACPRTATSRSPPRPSSSPSASATPPLPRLCSAISSSPTSAAVSPPTPPRPPLPSSPTSPRRPSSRPRPPHRLAGSVPATTAATAATRSVPRRRAAASRRRTRRSSSRLPAPATSLPSVRSANIP